MRSDGGRGFTVLDDSRDETWRELGVGNWARDKGLVLTKEHGLFHLWGSDPRTRILTGVELHEVELYLGDL
jgi:hypothetical protein